MGPLTRADSRKPACHDHCAWRACAVACGGPGAPSPPQTCLSHLLGGTFAPSLAGLVSVVLGHMQPCCREPTVPAPAHRAGLGCTVFPWLSQNRLLGPQSCSWHGGYRFFSATGNPTVSVLGPGLGAARALVSTSYGFPSSAPSRPQREAIAALIFPSVTKARKRQIWGLAPAGTPPITR